MSTCTRLVPFVGIGALGFLLQMAALDLMTRWAHMPYPVAAAIAVELAIVHNFFWHDRWTWGDRRRRGVLIALRRLAQFNGAAGLVTLAGNVLVTCLLVEALALPVIVANASAVGAMSLASYVVADRWVFRALQRPSATIAAAAVAWSALATLQAAEPAPQTMAAFDRYARAIEERRAGEARDPRRFLAADFGPPAAAAALRRRLEQGEVHVEPLQALADIPSGRVHHWRGYALIPGVSVDQLLDAVSGAAAAGESWQQDVVRTRLLQKRPDGYVLFLKLRREEIVTVLYNTEHVVTHTRDAYGRVSTRSVARRIAEIEEIGNGAEREKPAGDDRGFLWRMHSYWRYAPSARGVLVELESVTLSRDLPWGLGPVANPVIRRIARDSMRRTLVAMQARFGTPSEARGPFGAASSHRGAGDRMAGQGTLAGGCGRPRRGTTLC